MSTTTLSAIKLHRTIHGTPEQVFAAWTDPRVLARWFAPGTAEAKIDLLEAHPGGRYRIEMHDAANAKVYVVGGRFLELEPPRRLVITWAWEGEPGGEPPTESRVIVELAERDGATELTLTHEGLPDPKSADGHKQGWEGCLDKLEQCVVANA
jgi:hypothetical protein